MTYLKHILNYKCYKNWALREHYKEQKNPLSASGKTEFQGRGGIWAPLREWIKITSSEECNSISNP